MQIAHDSTMSGHMCYKSAKTPLGNMPLIEAPFHRVVVDQIGPIAPKSDKGNRYILTIVDYGTRFPEAVAFKTSDYREGCRGTGGHVYKGENTK